MKKLISISIVFALCLSTLVSCGGAANTSSASATGIDAIIKEAQSLSLEELVA